MTNLEIIQEEEKRQEEVKRELNALARLWKDIQAGKVNFVGQYVSRRHA